MPSFNNASTSQDFSEKQLKILKTAQNLEKTAANPSSMRSDEIFSRLSQSFEREDEEDFTAEIDQLTHSNDVDLLNDTKDEDVPMPFYQATRFGEDGTESEWGGINLDENNSRNGRMFDEAIQNTDEEDASHPSGSGESGRSESESDDRSRMDFDKDNETTFSRWENADVKMKIDVNNGINLFSVEASDIKIELSPPNEPQGQSPAGSPVVSVAVPCEIITDLCPQSLVAAVNRMSGTLFEVKEKVGKIEADVEEMKDKFTTVSRTNRSQAEGDYAGLDGKSKQKHAADKIQHRPAQQVKLSGVVRELVRKLMKQSDQTTEVPSPPTRKQIRLHANGVRGYGPSLDNFVIDYLGKPQSPWNIACKTLFIRHFFQQGYQSMTTDKKIIGKAFDTRFHSLRRDYKNMNEYRRDPVEKGLKLSNAARRKRKLAKYRRRVAVVKSLPKSAHFAPYFCLLTVDGMSSDGSDYESDGTLVYRKFPKVWRSKALDLWLQDLDNLHLAMRQMPMNRISKGSMPHEGLQGTVASEKDPVTGLPKNFYRSQWLSELDEDSRETLELQPSQPFPDLTEEVARRHFKRKTDANKILRERESKGLEEEGKRNRNHLV